MTETKTLSDTSGGDKARLVEITFEPVELYKILKFEAVVDSGGQAKVVIADGAVLVNGVVELQKRKKIFAGDEIQFNGELMRIQLLDPKASR